MENGRRRIDLVLQVRTLQNILKVQLNRQMDKCELMLVEDDVENRLVVRLHGSNGVVKTHKLTYQERKSMFPTASEQSSRITFEAKTIQDLLDHFGSRSTGEIELICRSEYLTIRSQSDEVVNRSESVCSVRLPVCH
jgi:hypothetical protein